MQSQARNTPSINELAPGDRRVLNENEVANRWGLSPKTLQRWRSEGRGPKYLKLSKRVGYPLESVKRVSWDQSKLAAIAQRIAASGDNVEDFVSIDYAVSESRFNNWPPALREQFATARTVKPGKPTFRLTTLSTEAAR